LVKGSHQRIGDCDVLHAEVCDMYTRMQITNMEGFVHLIVEESDSISN